MFWIKEYKFIFQIKEDNLVENKGKYMVVISHTQDDSVKIIGIPARNLTKEEANTAFDVAKSSFCYGFKFHQSQMNDYNHGHW